MRGRQNGKWVTGICGHTQLVALKAFEENGVRTASNVIDAALYAIEIKNEHNINLKAINISFGGGVGDLVRQKLTRSRRYRL